MSSSRKGVSVKARVITIEEYNDILHTLCSTFEYEDKNKSGEVVIRKFRPAKEVAFALELQANLGLLISDVLELSLNSFVLDEDGRCKLSIKERRAKKIKEVYISNSIYEHIKNYALTLNIGYDDKLFNKSIRTVQSRLNIVCKKLNLHNVSTHSFRKFYGMRLYEDNNYNCEIVKELLNHSNVTTTQKYLDLNIASQNHDYMRSGIM